MDTLIAAADGEGGGAPPARRTPAAARKGAWLRPGDRDGGEVTDARGARVLDRYRLLERLGSGGFGEVWRAQDELLRREVAVKRIPCAADGVGERAAREAQAAARLSHPGIVALYEAAERDEVFYLTSELVQGTTLAQLVAQDALCDREIVEIGLALCEALAHAHGRGVIHRDVKPQNILVPEAPCDRAGVAKLTDFGGAWLDGEAALTHTGDVLGTLAYMAPEQSEGLRVGPEADLYSLALVLYEALCGENPVRAATPAATVRRIGAELPSLRRLRGDLPPALSAAIDRALRPRPQDRGTLADLAAALGDALGKELEQTHAREDAVRGQLRPFARAADPIESAATAIGARRRASVAGGESTGGHAAMDGIQAFPPRQWAPYPHSFGPTDALEDQPPPLSPPAVRRRLPPPPRLAWLVTALALLAWQLAAGRSGLALLLAAGEAPLLAAMPRRASLAWLAPALAPLLGLAGLAAAFPVLAGRPVSARTRACLGALGYWWLCLAEVGWGRGMAPAIGFSTGFPGAHPGSAWAQPGWEGSLSAAAHALSPLLSPAALCGAALWAVGAIALPWIVRGVGLAVDLLLAGVWSAALLAGPPLLAAWLQTGAGTAVAPAVAVLAATLGALLAAALARGERAARPLRA